MFGSSELFHEDGNLSEGLESVLQLRAASTYLIDPENCRRIRDLTFPTP